MANLIKKKPKVFVMNRPIDGSPNALNPNDQTVSLFDIKHRDDGTLEGWRTNRSLLYNDNILRQAIGMNRKFREEINNGIGGSTDTTYTLRDNNMLLENEFKSTDTADKRKQYEAVRGLFQKQLFRLLKEKQKQP